MSGAGERGAFAALNLNWIRTCDGVWTQSDVHVDGLHAETARQLAEAVRDAAASSEDNPPGLVLTGDAGTGKTHLLGWLRARVQADGGYFFLVGPFGGGTPFWEAVAGALVDGLTRPADDGETQLRLFLRRLAGVVGASPAITAAVTGRRPLEPVHLKDFVVALRSHDRRVGGDCQDTLRALVLFASENLDDEDVGRGYLQSMAEQFPNERAERGMRAPAKPAAEIVRELSRLLALTGPAVIAVDQLDTATVWHPPAPNAPADTNTPDGTDAPDGTSPGGPPRSVDPDDEWTTAAVQEVADGLLGLRDLTTRTLCVLACLPTTWDLIATRAVRPVPDRFRALSPLGPLGDAELADRLVARRFARRYELIGFTPPYPTWPVHPAALRGAAHLTARALLRAIDTQLRASLAAGSYTDLYTLDPATGGGADPPATAREPGDTETGGVLGDPPTTPGRRDLDPDGPTGRRLVVAFAELDVAWARLRAAAPSRAALSERNEDGIVPGLLAAGLDAWIAELGQAGEAFTRDPLPGAKPALHARLRRSLSDNAGDEAHWSFRAILTTHPRTAVTRLNSAATMAGLAAGVGAGKGGRAGTTRRPPAGATDHGDRRALVALRTTAWDSRPGSAEDSAAESSAVGPGSARQSDDGPGNADASDAAKIETAIAAFRRAGGVTHLLTDEDVRTFAALRQLLEGRHPALGTWLLARRPASSTPLLSAVLGALFDELAPEPAASPPIVAAPTARSPFVATAPTMAHLDPLTGRLVAAPDAPTTPLATSSGPVTPRQPVTPRPLVTSEAPGGPLAPTPAATRHLNPPPALATPYPAPTPDSSPAPDFSPAPDSAPAPYAPAPWSAQPLVTGAGLGAPLSAPAGSGAAFGALAGDPPLGAGPSGDRSAPFSTPWAAAAEAPPAAAPPIAAMPAPGGVPTSVAPARAVAPAAGAPALAGSAATPIAASVPPDGWEPAPTWEPAPAVAAPAPVAPATPVAQAPPAAAAPPVTSAPHVAQAPTAANPATPSAPAGRPGSTPDLPPPAGGQPDPLLGQPVPAPGQQVSVPEKPAQTLGRPAPTPWQASPPLGQPVAAPGPLAQVLGQPVPAPWQVSSAAGQVAPLPGQPGPLPGQFTPVPGQPVEAQADPGVTPGDVPVETRIGQAPGSPPEAGAPTVPDGSPRGAGRSPWGAAPADLAAAGPGSSPLLVPVLVPGAGPGPRPAAAAPDTRLVVEQVSAPAVADPYPAGKAVAAAPATPPAAAATPLTAATQPPAGPVSQDPVAATEAVAGLVPVPLAAPGPPRPPGSVVPLAAGPRIAAAGSGSLHTSPARAAGLVPVTPTVSSPPARPTAPPGAGAIARSSESRTTRARIILGPTATSPSPASAATAPAEIDGAGEPEPDGDGSPGGDGWPGDDGWLAGTPPHSANPWHSDNRWNSDNGPHGGSGSHTENGWHAENDRPAATPVNGVRPSTTGVWSAPPPPGAGGGQPVLIGMSTETGAPVWTTPTALRRPTVIFGGSGAGKTVLVRRLVEECALRGTSSIVLDLTGDLVRLGDAWPSPPAGWAPGDARLAQDYHAGTDVAVWTPGRPDGRPLDVTSLDPGELFHPPPGQRARVSVVSLAGLPTDDARHAFTHELLRAAVAWARERPTPDARLRGLIALDDAAAVLLAGADAATGDGTSSLAAEAGAHGLGLVLATGSPRALPDGIARLAATRFVGRLNAPAQLDAARAMVRALGGEAPDIGRLGVGEFYAAGDSIPLQRVTTPLCLSHHPGWPPPLDEILARARYH